jgi:hypothetical protein
MSEATLPVRRSRHARAGYGDLVTILLLAAVATLGPVVVPRVSTTGQLGLLGAAQLWACWRFSRFSLSSSTTWVIGYWFLSTVGRGYSLIHLHQGDAAIYRLLGSGSVLARQIEQSVQHELLALTFLALGIGLLRRRSGPQPALLIALQPRWPLSWALTVLSFAALPFQVDLHDRAAPTAGGTFVIDLPGYAATGLLVAIVAKVAGGRRPPMVLTAVLATYVAIKLALVGSKIGLLAVGVAVIVGAAATTNPDFLTSFIRRFAWVGVLIAGLLVFSIPVLGTSPSQRVTFEERIRVGADALISRSYGLDAEMASQVWLDKTQGGYLGGSSLYSIVYSWVPRQLWPDKPKAFSEWFGENIFSFSPQSGDRFFSPSYTGEWLLNFGVPGVAIGWLLFGLGLSACDRIQDLGVRVTVLLGLTHLVEGSLVTQFWLAAPFVIGAILVRPSTAPGVRQKQPVAAEHTSRSPRQ